MPLTADRPKVLVEVGGEPILIRMLGQLHRLGLSAVTMIVGDRSDLVRQSVDSAALPMAVDWVLNKMFSSTNNSWSLALAGDVLRQGALLIEGDVVADQEILANLIDSPLSTCWAARRFTREMEGACLQFDAAGRLCALSIVRGASDDTSDGWKSMGLLKISPAYGAQLASWLQEEVALGRRDRYYDQVVADHVSEDAPLLLTAEDGFWIEVDTPQDVVVANRLLERRR